MWSELFVLWSILSYGITADPLPEDTDGVTFKWQTWRWALLLRIVVAAVLSYWICHSVIVSAVLLFVIRGGTYIVRGCLRKTETLPQLILRGTEADCDTGTKRLDIVEMNRGRLIGNLERLVLTVVVVAGSYAALGFLVAAKGLIRSEELQEREFAEYFLVGSLCSVLVALCAGLVIRYTL